MARRQTAAFKQRVEQLVAESKFIEAWNLLADYGWVPRGSGYQEHYPTGLTLFARIYPGKEILKSKSGRFWAWKVSTPEEADLLEAFRQKMMSLELPQIAGKINTLIESIRWWNQQIHEGTDSNIRQIQTQIRLAAEIFAEKVGIAFDDFNAMQQRLQQELVKYDEMLQQRWQEIFKIGTVFRIVGGGIFREDVETLFEVLDVFEYRDRDPQNNDKIVFTREQLGGAFVIFGSKDVAELLPVNSEPIYPDDPHFSRTAVGGQFPETQSGGFDICKSGTVFEYRCGDHDLRNGLWETFYYDFWRDGH